MPIQPKNIGGLYSIRAFKIGFEAIMAFFLLIMLGFLQL
jgi:hypothetical protein